MLDINKQAMRYSQHGQKVTIYEKDDDGNIKYYVDGDGNKIPLIADEKVGFSEPVDFRANIAFSGGEAKVEEFGFNAADYDAIMLTDKNEFPLKKGDLIWLNSEVAYIDEDAKTVDETSADFTIVGVKPALTSTKYVLKAIVK